jgi:hypothetical protein
MTTRYVIITSEGGHGRVICQSEDEGGGSVPMHRRFREPFEASLRVYTVVHFSSPEDTLLDDTKSHKIVRTASSREFGLNWDRCCSGLKRGHSVQAN